MGSRFPRRNTNENGDAMNILEKIDKLRTARGWSVNNLATEAMLTQSTLNNLYARNAEPKISTLRAICNAFGITLAEFFADDELSAEEQRFIVDKKLQRRISELTFQQKEALLDFLRCMM